MEFWSVVTNKHVVVDSTSGIIWVHGAKNQHRELIPSGKAIGIKVPDFESHWIFHPSPEVDLCMLPFDSISARSRRLLYTQAISRSSIPNDNILESLSAVEDVLMVGYPRGLWDNDKNLPLFRRGITASHPCSDLFGKPCGAIDIAAIPGSSGSPVVICNEGGYNSRGGFIVGSRFLLLGVLSQTAILPQEGTVTVGPVPTNVTIRSNTDLFIHLGYYVKARELLTLSQHTIDLLKSRGLI